jgi:hypothetical protein
VIAGRWQTEEASALIYARLTAIGDVMGEERADHKQAIAELRREVEAQTERLAKLENAATERSPLRSVG